MKNKTIVQNLLVIAMYAIFICLLYFFSATEITIVDSILFIVGVLVASVLLIGDAQYLHVYYQENGSAGRLMTRSTLFLLLFVPLSLFILTSSGSLLGKGVVLGLGTLLFLEMWALRFDSVRFHEKFLYQVKKSYTLEVVQYSIIAFGLFVTVLHILAFR